MAGSERTESVWMSEAECSYCGDVFDPITGQINALLRGLNVYCDACRERDVRAR